MAIINKKMVIEKVHRFIKNMRKCGSTKGGG